VGQRGRVVQQRLEHLVVAGGGDSEHVADCLFLGAGVLPPLLLERQDLALPFLESVVDNELEADALIHPVTSGRHKIFSCLHKSLMITWRPSPHS